MDFLQFLNEINWRNGGKNIRKFQENRVCKKFYIGIENSREFLDRKSICEKFELQL